MESITSKKLPGDANAATPRTTQGQDLEHFTPVLTFQKEEGRDI